MQIVQNRKEWRNNTVMSLIANGREADKAIFEAKEIEKFVFQDDFIVETKKPEQREALKKLIESLGD